MLADDEKEKRRDKNHRAAHIFYRTYKTDKNNNADFGDVNENPNTIEPVASGSKESDDNELSTTNELSLTVTVFFHHSSRSQCKGGKQRVSHALTRSYKTISTLKDKNDNLRKKIKTTQKRLCRIQTRTANLQTPRSKTNLILKKSGIDPKNLLDIRKRLICNECLTEEVQIAVDDNPTRKKAVHKVVFGNIVIKNRLKTLMQSMTSLNSRKLFQDFRMKKTPLLKQKADRLRQENVGFLIRDDSSRILPGKTDTVRVGKGKYKNEY